MANGLSPWQRFWRLLDRGLFGPPSQGDGLLPRVLRILRYPYAILRDLLGGELNLRATGLVYATLLALIPLIALSFALLKAVDAHRDLEPFLLEFFRPVGEAGPVITHRIMVFAENVSGGLVGILGFTVLLWTLVGAVKKIEDSLNYVWQVRRARSIARRVLEFVALLIIGPLVIAAVLATSKLAFDQVSNYAIHDFTFGAQLVNFAIGLAPYVLVTALFTAIYMVMPNTRVRFWPALGGAFAAGVFWAAIGKAFTAMVLYTTRLTLVYAGFAVVIAVFVWTYLGWLILLAGAQLAFYLQNPQNLRVGHSPMRLTGTDRERLALEIMARVAAGHRSGHAPATIDRLARQLALPGSIVTDMTEKLESDGLLAISDECHLYPGREIASIPLSQIIASARSYGWGEPLQPTSSLPGVLDVQKAMEQAWHSAVAQRTLADLVGAGDRSAAAANWPPV
jgi:membrane protein